MVDWMNKLSGNVRSHPADTPFNPKQSFLTSLNKDKDHHNANRTNKMV
jgi:hypothetical protein